MGRSIGFRLVIWVSLSVSALQVNATPLHLAEPDPANYLQGGTGGGEQALIEQALAMPAVSQAMQVFASRGYIREASADRGGTAGTAAVVALAYSVPMHPEVGAVIWVSTDLMGDVPQTVVMGGLVEIDPITHEMLASSLMTTPGQAGFQITIADMSKTNSSNYGWREAVVDLMEFLACFATICTGCGQGCAGVFMPPAIATCTTICCVVAAVGCGIAAAVN